MTQSNRLMQLLEIEQRHEEQAGEIPQNCKHSYQLASDMLEQLVEHKERYMSKLTRSRSVGATPEEMRFPPLELFRWRRVVFDEFHELECIESDQVG